MDREARDRFNIPCQAGSDSCCNRNVYRGSSMYPTFRYGDFVWVVPAVVSNLHPGDVITFRSDEGDHRTIHRVLKISKNGVTTKGDANKNPDLEIVTEENLLGRVEWVERRRVFSRVRGGYVGLLWAIMLWQCLIVGSAFKGVCFNCNLLLASVCRLLVRSVGLQHLVRKFWHPKFRIIWVKSNGSVKAKVLCGKRVVAVCESGQAVPHIRLPYELVLDRLELQRHLQHFSNMAEETQGI